MDDRNLIALVEGLLDAASDGQAWTEVLEQLCLGTGSEAAALRVVEAGSTHCLYCVTHTPGQRLARRCQPAEGQSCAWGRGRASVPGASGPSTTDLWCRQGLLGQLMLRRPTADGATAGPAGLPETLSPLLGRALWLGWRLQSCSRRQALLRWAVDQAGTGVVLLDATGRVEFHNDAAGSLLAQADGLGLRQGRLSASRPADDASLQDSLRRALAGDGGTGGHGGATLRIERPSGLSPYCLSVAPVHCQPPPPGLEPAGAVVRLSDPERTPELQPAQLRTLFGFTRRESELALALLDGAVLAEAAERLGIAEKTARIHLQGLFRKTRTHRQTDLMRVLWAVPGVSAHVTRGVD